MVERRGLLARLGGRRRPGAADTDTGLPNGAPADGGPWPTGADRQLCEILAEIPGVGDPAFRERTLEELGRRLGLPGAFAVPYSALATDHLQDVVRGCRRWHDPAQALLQLADVLRFQRDGTAAVGWLTACVEAITVPGLLAPAPQLALLRILRTVRPTPAPAKVLHLVEAACAPGETHPVRSQDGLPEAVTRLNQARLDQPHPGRAPHHQAHHQAHHQSHQACYHQPRTDDTRTDGARTTTHRLGQSTAAHDPEPPDDRAAPPLLLRFLTRLAQEAAGPEATALTDLVKQQAHELGVAEADLVAPASAPAAHRGSPAEQHHPLVLQIVLDDVSPVGSDAEPVYAFEALLYDTTEHPWRLVSKHASDDQIPQSALRSSGSRHLTTWRELAAAAADAEGLRVEFLLPWSLLGHPAELWPMDEDDYPVGMHFPVVVRSLDRIRSALWHPAWKNKWRALEAAVDSGAPGTVADLPGWFALDADLGPIDAETSGRTLHVGGRQGDVRRWLDERPQTAILALCFPYAYHPKHRAVPYRAVKDAVREGIPVMLWRRDSGSSIELHELLGELTASHLAGLAAHIHRRRRASAEDDPADLGHHLTLLWDEPGQAAWLAPTPFSTPAHRTAPDPDPGGRTGAAPRPTPHQTPRPAPHPDQRAAQQEGQPA
ncbi:hypothetical protein ACFVVX_23775 [Kitasatospora sp. NPDC058170]|uniref:VMAP-C domain-containing protein n=1 Tax=Kitasatospora sp. NPDC058170 TaxID=3346364 RepID=UPI0036D9C8F2